MKPPRGKMLVASALCLAVVGSASPTHAETAEARPSDAAAAKSAETPSQDAKPADAEQAAPSQETGSASTHPAEHEAEAPSDSAPPEPLDEIGRALRDLRSPSYEERVRATHRLMALEGDTLERLEKALSDADSVEVQHRLMSILRHRAVRAMYRDVDPEQGSSLGVRFETAPLHTVKNQRQPGVRVVLTLPGFPAHERLWAGDIIVGVQGESLSPRDPASDFVDTVARHPPGEPLEIEYLRNGERMNAMLKTAPKRALERIISAQRPVTLHADFLQRLSAREADLRDAAKPPQSISAPSSAEPLKAP